MKRQYTGVNQWPIMLPFALKTVLSYDLCDDIYNHWTPTLSTFVALVYFQCALNHVLRWRLIDYLVICRASKSL